MMPLTGPVQRAAALSPSNLESARQCPAPLSLACLQPAPSQHDSQAREFDACSCASSSMSCEGSGSWTSATVVEQAAGLWSLLPEEVVETILCSCTPAKLAMLQSTCRFFRSSLLIDRIARHSLKAVPRARNLKPSIRKHETYLALLQFINHQSAAAAQATAIACGSHHTCSLLVPKSPSPPSTPSSSRRSSSCSSSQGTARHALYTFGRNLHGQLGCGDFTDHAGPVEVPLGFQACTDNSSMEEETVPAVVSCGAHYSMAMSRRGELFSWGLGRSGELGQGPWAQLGAPQPRHAQMLQRVRVVSIACGASHTLAIGESGALWCCGSNGRGQLGNGTLVGSCNLQLVHNLPRTRIVSAAAGAAHSVALASNGSLYTWGDGSQGQLGHEQLQCMSTPGCQNTIILPLPQKVASLSPGSLSPECRVTAVSAGSSHTLVLQVGGGILGFGCNDTGCLGLGDTNNRWSPARVPLALEGEEDVCIRAVQLSCGSHHSLALVSRQGTLEVRAAGANNWGQLGNGDMAPSTRFIPTGHVPRVCAVQAGSEHSAAVTEDGALFTWGRGDSGQLGHGDALSRGWPTRVEGFMAVHPDKTLRRNKRDLPLVRPVVTASNECEAMEWAPMQ